MPFRPPKRGKHDFVCVCVFSRLCALMSRGCRTAQIPLFSYTTRSELSLALHCIVCGRHPCVRSCQHLLPQRTRALRTGTSRGPWIWRRLWGPGQKPRLVIAAASAPDTARLGPWWRDAPTAGVRGRWTGGDTGPGGAGGGSPWDIDQVGSLPINGAEGLDLDPSASLAVLARQPFVDAPI